MCASNSCDKRYHVFHFWYIMCFSLLIWFLEREILFVNIQSRFRLEKVPAAIAFPANMHLTSAQYSFSCQSNPDWSVIQISGASAVCIAVFCHELCWLPFQELESERRPIVGYAPATWQFWCIMLGNLISYVVNICLGYWPSVMSRWLDIGQVFFCVFVDRDGKTAMNSSKCQVKLWV